MTLLCYEEGAFSARVLRDQLTHVGSIDRQMSFWPFCWAEQPAADELPILAERNFDAGPCQQPGDFTFYSVPLAGFPTFSRKLKEARPVGEGLAMTCLLAVNDDESYSACLPS